CFFLFVLLLYLFIFVLLVASISFLLHDLVIFFFSVLSASTDLKHLAYSYPFVPFQILVTYRTWMEAVLQFLFEQLCLPILLIQAVEQFVSFSGQHHFLVMCLLFLLPLLHCEKTCLMGFLHSFVFSLQALTTSLISY